MSYEKDLFCCTFIADSVIAEQYIYYKIDVVDKYNRDIIRDI